MTTEVKKIDLTQWPRKNHFNFYKDFKQPCFNICLSIDITSAYLFAEQNKISKLHTLLYLSSKACNQIPAFNLRIDEQGNPCQVAKSHPSATLMNKEQIFTFCNFEYREDLREFIDQAQTQQALALKQEPLSLVDNRSDLIFYSIIPWLSFTSYSHAYSNECLDIPKIVFGKFNKQGSTVTMPISVELNHALADGIDLARYVEVFTNEINQLSVNTTLL